VTLLRSLIPKAKVLLNKRILAKQAKERAEADQRRKRNAEAIETILRDSKRLTVRGSFKMYADALAERYQAVLAVIDAIEQKDSECSKHATIAIAGIVDSANSTAAICTNKAIQDEVGVRTRDIAIEVANVVSFYSALAGTDGRPVADAATIEAKLKDVSTTVREQVYDALRFLAAASNLIEQLDRAKAAIEDVAANASLAGRVHLDNPSTEAYVELLSSRARALNEKLSQVSNRAMLEPHQLGALSEEAATLTRELLATANEIALSCGIDLSLPDPFQSCSGTITEHQKQQLLSMLNAAKGFAAATAGMVDVLKLVPNQSDDESIQTRLILSTRAAQNALGSLVSAAQAADSSAASATAPATATAAASASQAATAPAAEEDEVDAEVELLQVLDVIHTALSKLRSESEATQATGASDSSASTSTASPSDARKLNTSLDAADPLVSAIHSLTQATASLVRAAADAQQSLKANTSTADVYRKDPQWSRGLVAAAKSVAETTQQLAEVALSDSSTEEVVAAARCVTGTTAQLVTFIRAKGDTDSESHHRVDSAAKAIAQATNQLVNVAKAKHMVTVDEEVDAQIAEIQKQQRPSQIRAEFEAQARIAKLETSLDAARQYLFKLRRAVYGPTHV
jgi:hypothetical protein